MALIDADDHGGVLGFEPRMIQRESNPLRRASAAPRPRLHEHRHVLELLREWRSDQLPVHPCGLAFAQLAPPLHNTRA